MKALRCAGCAPANNSRQLAPARFPNSPGVVFLNFFRAGPRATQERQVRGGTLGRLLLPDHCLATGPPRARPSLVHRRPASLPLEPVVATAAAWRALRSHPRAHLAYSQQLRRWQYFCSYLIWAQPRVAAWGWRQPCALSGQGSCRQATQRGNAESRSRVGWTRRALLDSTASWTQM